MRRAASTWLHNVVRLICASSGPTKGCFEDSYRAVPGMQDVVKTHKFREEWIFAAHFIFTCKRDVRDVAASAVRRQLARPTPIEIIRFLTKTVSDEYELWKPYAALDLAYEQIKDKPEGQIALIADTMGVKIDPARIRHDVDHLPVAHPADPEILLHRNHFTDGRVGSYAETLPKDSIAAIESLFGWWLKDNGYDL